MRTTLQLTLSNAVVSIPHQALWSLPISRFLAGHSSNSQFSDIALVSLDLARVATRDSQSSLQITGTYTAERMGNSAVAFCSLPSSFATDSIFMAWPFFFPFFPFFFFLFLSVCLSSTTTPYSNDYENTLH
jgi:hypothetical protein